MKYIAIETNVEVFELYRPLWQMRNIEGIMVSSMSEGISKAIEIEKSANILFFISISADDIDFMPQLDILSKETNAPILIAVSKSRYSEREHHGAMRNGADFYAPFSDEPEMNIEAVISAIEGIRRRAAKGKSTNKIIAHGNILIDVERHQAFVKDKEVILSSAEMGILHYLLLNRGIILKHEQFFQNVYTGNDRITTDGLYSAIKRLRKKIREVSQIEYIETVKNVGYCLWTEGR